MPEKKSKDCKIHQKFKKQLNEINQFMAWIRKSEMKIFKKNQTKVLEIMY